jgi:hypothetical protein
MAPNQKSTGKPSQSTKTQVADTPKVNTNFFNAQPARGALLPSGSSASNPAQQYPRQPLDVDRPAVSTISTAITKLQGGWSPALYGEQPLKLETVLSDPSTDETLRKDCMEIFHVLSQKSRGQSEYLPWFNQVEQYISKESEAELDCFTAHIGYEGAAAKYLAGRRSKDARYRGICERLEAEEAEQGGLAGQAGQAVGQVGLAGQAGNPRPKAAAKSGSGTRRVCKL